ncbi:SRPBCC family protein [Streptomyces scopuliridis]|uniref:SRPBCC family protein n=1 Tax=Streptomyces scopuliridis TaxID=452529 RepID=UPI0036A0D0C0
MSTLEEQIDISVPTQVVWDRLHRVEEYTRFVEGVRQVRAEGGQRAHVDVEAGGRAQEFDAEITDRDRGRVMAWRTRNGPRLAGTFSVLPIDAEHSRIQVRLEYDPSTVTETFGGPKGFAQATAIERLVRQDLEQFKDLVEREH